MRDNNELAKEYEIVIDVTARKHRRVPFKPIGGADLRSELRLEHIAGKTNGLLQAVGGFIPGQRLYFSIKSGSCKIIDRMTLEEHAVIDSKIREISNNDELFHMKFGTYEKDMDYSISKKDMPEWLWWIRRCMDHKNQFTAIKGEDKIPSYEEILKMNGGKLIVSEDYGLKPLSKDDQPFNVVSLEDFGIEEESGKTVGSAGGK